jgi:DNA/RNA endonuclease YhcR with UshA esterase domain
MNLTCVILLFLGSLIQEPEATPVIKPSEAANHVNKTVIVEMEVESSSFLKDKELCFLNSLKDHRSEDNFSVVLKKEALKVFKDNKIEDPAKHYLKKKIQVEGKVELFKDKPQIVLEKFEQLKVVGVRPEE